jgi:type I restriction enzyme, S subunit
MSDWVETTVGDVVARCYSGPSPTCEERNVRTDQEWGLLKTTAVTWAGWNEWEHKVPPSIYWHNKAIEVRPGDVLVTKAGPRHRVGVVVDVRSTQPRLMVSGKMIGLTPKFHNVMPRAAEVSRPTHNRHG